MAVGGLMEVFPNFKPELEPCACGCGLVGRPRKKQWNDGLGPHTRGCVCRRCVGGRQRGRSRAQEHRTARDTGGTREPLSGQLSGVDGRAGLHVWEETTNLAVCRGIRRWWGTKTVRSKVARLFSRPGGEYRWLILKDEKPFLVVGLYDDWADAVKNGDL